MTLCHLSTGRQLFALELTTWKIDASTSKSVSDFDKLNFLTETRHLNPGMTCIWRHNSIVNREKTIIIAMLRVSNKAKPRESKKFPWKNVLGSKRDFEKKVEVILLTSTYFYLETWTIKTARARFWVKISVTDLFYGTEASEFALLIVINSKLNHCFGQCSFSG